MVKDNTPYLLKIGKVTNLGQKGWVEQVGTHEKNTQAMVDIQDKKTLAI